MNRLKVALAAVIASGLVAAQAPPNTEQTSKASKPRKWDPTEVVCKKYPTALGTRIGTRRICKTNAEWDFIDRQQEEAVERAQIKPTGH